MSAICHCVHFWNVFNVETTSCKFIISQVLNAIIPYTSQCHMLLWGAILGRLGCTAVRCCLCWTEVNFMTWSWFGCLQWSALYSSDLGPDGIIVSHLDVLFAVVGEVKHVGVDVLNRKKKETVIISVPPVCSLLTLHLFWFKDVQSVSRSSVGRHSLLMLSAGTDWFNEVYNTPQWWQENSLNSDQQPKALYQCQDSVLHWWALV